MPERIQRRRTRGWRMPEGARYIGRPTRYGNPWRITQAEDGWLIVHATQPPVGPIPSRDSADRLLLTLYRDHLDHHPELVAQARRELAGKDLACFCAVNAPCHGDLLLAAANTPRETQP